MTKKKNLLILFFIFIIGCGYSPIFSSKDIKFGIDEITFINKNEINYEIKSQLTRYQNNNNKSKIYDLRINTNSIKSISLKDSKGDPKIFLIEIFVEITVIKNGKSKDKKIFNKSFNYNNDTNKFNLSKYEKNIEKNMINKIIEEIDLYLQFI